MTERAEHRKTVLVVAAMLVLLALWSMARGRTAMALYTSSAAALLAFLGICMASFASRFHKVWMRIAHVLGYVNTRLLLLITFFGVIFPIGLVARLTGRDRLMRRRSDRSSYWIPRRTTRQTRQGFERAF